MGLKMVFPISVGLGANSPTPLENNKHVAAHAVMNTAKSKFSAFSEMDAQSNKVEEEDNFADLLNYHDFKAS